MITVGRGAPPSSPAPSCPIAPERAIIGAMSLARSLLLWGARSAWLEAQMRRRAFARTAVRRFMPGEDLAAALAASADLAAHGMTGTVLTQLGENLSHPSEAEAVRRHYLTVLDEVRARALPAQVSVKLTQLGLDFDVNGCVAALESLVERAAPDRVWIDMEDSRYTDVTLDVFRRARARHENVGLCLQAYLRRTPADLEGLLPDNPAIRLVKGAYAEPPERAYPRKRDTDAAYAKLAARLIAHAAEAGAPAPVLGTHDGQLTADVLRRAEAAGLARSACEVHMLYGIRVADQQRLARAGHTVRVLISYGSAWFRWYMRRLAERPANVWFVLRSAF
jgi:proline dehydrogenase